MYSFRAYCLGSGVCALALVFCDPLWAHALRHKGGHSHAANEALVEVEKHEAPQPGGAPVESSQDAQSLAQPVLDTEAAVELGPQSADSEHEASATTEVMTEVAEEEAPRSGGVTLERSQDAQTLVQPTVDTQSAAELGSPLSDPDNQANSGGAISDSSDQPDGHPVADLIAPSIDRSDGAEHSAASKEQDLDALSEDNVLSGAVVTKKVEDHDASLEIAHKIEPSQRWSLTLQLGAGLSQADAASIASELRGYGIRASVRDINLIQPAIGIMMDKPLSRSFGVRLGVLSLGDYSSEITLDSRQEDAVKRHLKNILPLGGLGVHLATGYSRPWRRFDLRASLGAYLGIDRDISLRLNGVSTTVQGPAAAVMASGGVIYRAGDSLRMGVNLTWTKLNRQIVVPSLVVGYAL